MNTLRKHLPRWLLPVLVLPALMVFSGCDEDEGPTGPFQDASLVAVSYVGYTDGVSMTPTCGACHSGITQDWGDTDHASALTTLYNSGHQASYCLPCHTTGWDETDGIYGADDAWASAAADTLLLRDVQCEQCHGPASQHNALTDNPTDVLNPDDKELWDAELCGQCHWDSHHPFLEEWESSGHAVSSQAAGGFVTTNAPCMKCHVAQNFVENLTEGEIGSPVTDPAPVTCQACHTSHNNDNPGQLRSPLGQDIICAKCHTADGAMPGTTVHNSVWEVFSGTLGFTYLGETYENSVHTEAFSGRVCLGCHLVRTPYVSDTVPAVTGHTFQPQLEICQRCHAGATSFDIYGVQTETQVLIATLKAEIQIARSTGVDTSASFDNALYVLQAAEAEGSFGVHNRKYIQKLLQDAINDLDP
jgi:predicted CXXCH cytochrome family protein